MTNSTTCREGDNISANETPPPGASFDSTKYYYDEEAAERVVRWVERFASHSKGALGGKPLILEDWQKNDIIRPAFGWKKQRDDTRKYNTVYVELPRKNGKSLLGAAIALYLLCADGEKGAEVYSAAGDKDQARMVFEVAKAMIENSKKRPSSLRLAKALKPFKDAIVHQKSGSFYKVISAEAYTKHGFNAHGIIMDELHVQPNRELYDVLTTSVGARTQPFIFIITTAGIKNSFGETMHDYAANVRDGVIIDESFLPIIYGADIDDDPFDPETHRKANPGYGTIVKDWYLTREAQKAKNSPSYLNTFLQLHLNIWVGSEFAWIPDHIWQLGNIEPVTTSKLKGRKCFGAIDLASTRDLTCFLLFFPPDDTCAHYTVLPYFFCPEDSVLEREQRENVNYSTWVRSNFVHATPGNVVDYSYIRSTIHLAKQDFEIVSIAFDRWNSSQLMVELVQDGIECNPFGQGFSSMSYPSKEVEKLLMEGNINHGGNPVLRWNNSNVVIEMDAAENIKPSKKKSKDRIDGMVALIMAVGEYIQYLSEAEGPSRYETEALNVVSLSHKAKQTT